jgi:hypothetical protein
MLRPLRTEAAGLWSVIVTIRRFSRPDHPASQEAFAGYQIGEDQSGEYASSPAHLIESPEDLEKVPARASFAPPLSSGTNAISGLGQRLVDSRGWWGWARRFL